VKPAGQDEILGRVVEPFILLSTYLSSVLSASDWMGVLGQLLLTGGGLLSRWEIWISRSAMILVVCGALVSGRRGSLLRLLSIAALVGSWAVIVASLRLPLYMLSGSVLFWVAVALGLWMERKLITGRGAARGTTGQREGS